MPLYDFKCSTDGVFEVRAPISEAPSFAACPKCERVFPQYFGPANAASARIDDFENVGSERRDGTSGQLITLGEKKISLGTDAQGKEHFRYEPHRAAEVGSRRRFLEIAKTQGLSAGDGGRYRTTPR